MEQRVQFCTTQPGVRIAYATIGAGTPYVYVPGWISHIELEWASSPLLRARIERYAQHVTSVRFDKRGTGLSSRNVGDYSLDARVADLEALVDHIGLRQFHLGGLSEGGPIAIAYAARHPERVLKLVIEGSYANGSGIAGTGNGGTELRDAVLAMVKAEWGLASKLLSDLFLDKNSILTPEDFAMYQQSAATKEDAYAILEQAIAIDVRPLLSSVQAPALIVHGRDDRVVPLECGQEVAAGIRGAQFHSGPGGHVPSEDVMLANDAAVIDFLTDGGAVPGARPAQTQAPEPGLVTIMFTDIEGHTDMMRRLGDDAGRALLREHERAVRAALTQHGGTEIKTIGDAFMASFASARRALDCAVAIQRAFAAHNASAPEPLRVRVGVNAGEPIAEEGDLYGSAVIMASRIAAMAKGGEILASDVVRQLVAGKGFLFADRGDTVLRGFEDPVRIYDVRWTED